MCANESGAHDHVAPLFDSLNRTTATLAKCSQIDWTKSKTEIHNLKCDFLSSSAWNFSTLNYVYTLKFVESQINSEPKKFWMNKSKTLLSRKFRNISINNDYN